MKRFNGIINNKKGVSSLFITIYVLLLAVLLISALFISLTIANSSLNSYYQIDEERRQEVISIEGPGGLQLDGATVTHLRVQNLGQIVVRIRSLYIGELFKCDPSTFNEDAYIKPKETLWIEFPETVNINYENTKNLYWTVTTERGTGSSEKGRNILEGGSDTIVDTDILRFGPFALVFDDFNWRSGTGAWQPGWEIPKSTKDVIWRIHIINIDKESILLTKDTMFMLVNNDDTRTSRLFWYIKLPQEQSYITIQPDDDKVFIEFAGKKNEEPDLNFQPYITCYNLLLVSGYYEDKWTPGTPDLNRPIAQTIPFEAVLVKPQV